MAEEIIDNTAGAEVAKLMKNNPQLQQAMETFFAEKAKKEKAHMDIDTRHTCQKRPGEEAAGTAKRSSPSPDRKQLPPDGSLSASQIVGSSSSGGSSMGGASSVVTDIKVELERLTDQVEKVEKISR